MNPEDSIHKARLETIRYRAAATQQERGWYSPDVSFLLGERDALVEELSELESLRSAVAAKDKQIDELIAAKEVRVEVPIYDPSERERAEKSEREAAAKDRLIEEAVPYMRAADTGAGPVADWLLRAGAPPAQPDCRVAPDRTRDTPGDASGSACVSLSPGPVSPAQPAKCSPLCGASKAYGRFDAPWKHEPECPVRIEAEQGPAQPAEEQLRCPHCAGKLSSARWSLRGASSGGETRE